MVDLARADAEQISTDRALVDRLLEGDEEAYREFFADRFPGLFRFALSRLGGDEDQAQEAAQKAFVTAFEKLDSFRGDSTLFTWLCGICRFQIGDLRKRRGRWPRLVSASRDGDVALKLDLLPNSADDPAAALDRQERVAQVHQALDELPPRYGQALEWKYIEGLSVRHIAERLEVREKAAESLLTRAREAFRRRYDQLADGT